MQISCLPAIRLEAAAKVHPRTALNVLPRMKGNVRIVKVPFVCVFEDCGEKAIILEAAVGE